MASVMSGVVKRVYAKELGVVKSWPRRKLDKMKKAFAEVNKYMEQHPNAAWLFRFMVIIGVALIIWGLVHTYNQFSYYRTKAKTLLADVGKELKRRDNLLPNLIAVVREYTIHEADSFKYVSDAREKLVSVKSLAEEAKGASGFGLDKAMSKLFALFEQYPDLKATQSVQDLLKELAVTENRIAEAKHNYNENNGDYNQLTTSFPGTILYRVYGFPKFLPYISTEDDALIQPEVDTLRTLREKAPREPRHKYGMEIKEGKDE